jgi:hypothetical protein
MSPFQSFASLVCALSLAAFSLGCEGKQLHDDVDIVFDFDPVLDLDADEYHLHSPYVVGTEVTFDYAGDAPGWTLESSDPSVMALDPDGRGVRGVAVGEGTTTLTVRDAKGDVLEEAEVSAWLPDRATLVPNGMAIIGFPEPTDHATVEVDGTATFEVLYQRSGNRLFGTGLLSVGGDPDLGAVAVETSFWERREWLQLTPHAVGTATLPLYCGAVTLPPLTVTVVPPGSAVDMTLVYDRDLVNSPEDGQSLTILARVFDGKGEPIYGAEPSWMINEQALAGEGDLFRFEYREEASKSVAATYGGLRADLRFPGEDGHVDSSNNIGCGVAPGRTRSDGAAWAWLAVAALFVRRLGRSATRLAPALLLTGVLGCADVCEEAADKLEACFPSHTELSDASGEGECSELAECTAECTAEASCSEIEDQHAGRPSPYADCIATCR